MLTVHTSEGKKKISAQNGMTLLQALSGEAGIHATCGGKKTCGKCKIKAVGALSKMEQDEESFLTTQEVSGGVRLACMVRVLGDADVFPETERYEIQTSAALPLAPFLPEITVATGSVLPAQADAQRSDEKGLLQALNGQANRISYSALQTLQETLRKEQYNVDAAIRDGEVIAVLPVGAPAYGLAADIGTTTVAAYYYNLRNGACIAVKSGLNGQGAHGADVISRIGYGIEDKDGLSNLQKEIIGQLNGMTAEICSEAGLLAASLVGNTVMQHLAAGISPREIAAAPFTSATDFGFSIPFSKIGLSGCPDGLAYFAPCAAGYVGGDILAGLEACGGAAEEGLILFLDIGTNGEMALGNRDGFLCCATAAGPAFEGAHIEKGCGGVAGAVDSVALRDGQVAYTTIDGQPPVGLCGSGLIDAMATMVRAEICDETGRILDEDELPDELAFLIEEGETGNRFWIDRKKELYLTQKDVRELQLAKAAIAAGIRVLLSVSGKREEDISALYLAGGFGAHINQESAAAIGLFPSSLLSKVRVVGNAAGAGAANVLRNKNGKEELSALLEKMRYVELSSNDIFMEEYVEQMMF